MGNASGRKDEAGPSGTISSTTNEEGEESMEFAAPGGPFPESMVQSPPHIPSSSGYASIFTPQVPVSPSQRPNDMMQSKSAAQYSTRNNYSGMGIPVMITWSYCGKQVAIEGSWDNWSTTEFLQNSGKDFRIMKVLPSGVYHYRFIVDGQWRNSPELHMDRDELGNVFNVLDIQHSIPEVPNNVSGSESPPSPISSYNNSPFSLEDFDEKLPELPLILQQSPLDRPSAIGDNPESLEKPLNALLNHLYIQKDCTGLPLVALSSTHKFRKKYVTTVLYKPLKKVKK